MTSKDLHPQLKPGDFAVVRRVPVSTLAAGDVVVCQLGLETGFRRVRRLIRTGSVDLVEAECNSEREVCLNGDSIVGKVVRVVQDAEAPFDLVSRIKQMLGKLKRPRG
ncbi:MAG: hypothetical protein ACYCW6_00900 [Candidatus Xenobia bacterium]